jgi:CheY-like chemotaxis protein
MNTHVLLVDDDQDLCLLLAARLSQHGFHVTWKPSSVEALAALEATPVDVVVTDASMAGMNGFELCERIVANHRATATSYTAASATTKRSLMCLYQNSGSRIEI